jgi:hypothetical protein
MLLPLNATSYPRKNSAGPMPLTKQFGNDRFQLARYPDIRMPNAMQGLTVLLLRAVHADHVTRFHAIGTWTYPFCILRDCQITDSSDRRVGVFF